MRHSEVSRFSLALTALLAAAAVVFAWTASPAVARAPGDAGARLFDLRCGACHDPGGLAESLRASPDRDATASALLDFLEAHGDAPAAEDRAIVERLRALAGR